MVVLAIINVKCLYQL